MRFAELPRYLVQPLLLPQLIPRVIMSIAGCSERPIWMCGARRYLDYLRLGLLPV